MEQNDASPSSTTIRVDAVDPARRDEAQAEIRGLLEYVAGCPLGLVVVASTPSEAIQRIHEHIPGVILDPVEQTTDTGYLGRTVIKRTDSGFRFAVALNPEPYNGAFREWHPSQQSFRRLILTHELTHVSDYTILERALGIGGFYGLIASAHTSMSYSAHVTWWEYHAERRAVEAVESDALIDFYLDEQAGFARRLRMLSDSPLTPDQSRGLWQEVFTICGHVLGLEDAGIALPKDYEATDAYAHVLSVKASEIRSVLQSLHKTGETYHPTEIARLEQPLYTTMLLALDFSRPSAVTPSRG